MHKILVINNTSSGDGGTSRLLVAACLEAAW
jgi:hypothetical protein